MSNTIDKKIESFSKDFNQVFPTGRQIKEEILLQLVKQLALDIQKETARDMLNTARTVFLNTPGDTGKVLMITGLSDTYKQLTGEDYE